jgi:hypothetical protein
VSKRLNFCAADGARSRAGGARAPSACDVLLTFALHAGNVILLTLDKNLIE